ncbi:MAG: formylglycine-generating enzyme family protein, partial [Gammaproteobacteria bacterium]
ALAAENRERFDTAYSELRSAIDALGTDVAAYPAVFTALAGLEALVPDDPRVGQARDALAAAVNRNAALMRESGAWNDAVEISRQAIIALPDAAALATSLAGLEAERKQAIAAQERRLVQQAKEAIGKLLEDPVADRGWRASVRQHAETVRALAEPGDTWVEENAPRIAAIYLERAIDMRGEQRLAEGANLLADAERFAPALPGLAAEREALAAATEAFEREQAEQARLARIDGLKQTFETQARANEVVNAARTLEALTAETGAAEDPFVTRDAPRMLASAYYKLATLRAAGTDYAAALKFARACAELQPQRQDCKNAVRDYTVDGNRQDLEQLFDGPPSWDVGEALAKIAEISVLDPGVYGTEESDWSRAVAARLEALKESDGAGANALIEQAQDVFQGNTLIAAVGPYVPAPTESRFEKQIRAAMDAARLSEARELLKRANETEAQHPAIVELKGAYNARAREARALYETYKKQYTAKDYESALATMENALGVWGDSSTFRKEHGRVVAKLGELGAGTGADGRQRIIPAALPPTNPCEPRLAGFGKRKKGTCFYFVSGNQRGPLMVVVPAGEGFAQPFAIGKYEITFADFNRYCGLSGDCAVRKDVDGRLPVTDISLEQARAYVQWLSERTGQTYRLPTAAEWAYAANAGGAQPKKDYNCRVEQSGQLLKGQGTMGVNTGKANGWGLYNYVGNVQEWVAGDGSVTARGGAFEDAFSKCEIALEKSHDGSADGATGFRVLLELDAG